ncbi:Tetratricopeptide repeat protein [Phycisphaerae bacterium RAS1]|nr:Tetratricopeptide repeat protein [Phycisphaerae bacterium RAS1]
MRHMALMAILIISLLATGCQSTPRGAAGSPPIFDGIGAYGRPISTASPDAQRYFNQGLTWAYGFNYDEAIRSFRQAGALDPACAMADWGVALCNGPHINRPEMTGDQSKQAWAAIQEALTKANSATPVEKDLIVALSKRYAEAPPAIRRGLDEAYAAAMRDLWAKYPADADVGTLFAESLMDLQPWDLWTQDGKPKGLTLEIVATLERTIELRPDNPGALHLYIHAVEASPHPERARVAADRLRLLVPASGHLTHMPGHIYARIGEWAEASEANVRAIASDKAYRAISPRQGFYRVYMAHNRHFLAWTSMMEGRYEAARRAAREMLAEMPKEMSKEEAAFVDVLNMIEMDVLKRFGKWDAMLDIPQPAEIFPVSRALWRYSRGLALAARGDVAAAEAERTLFEQAAGQVSPEAAVGNNTAKDILQIARHMLAGEIAYRKGEIDAAARELLAGVTIEDTLKYDEPPDWMQPVRHTLAAIYTQKKMYAQAVPMYEHDLAKWKDNGWSLFGKAKAQSAAGEKQKAAETQRRFEQAWRRADTKIHASCLCVAAE